MFDVFFISYDEPDADRRWARVKELAPHAERVHGIEGILNAHIECSRRAITGNFFVVDGDAWLIDNWSFDFEPHQKDLVYETVSQRECTIVWPSKNAVNDLIYGYGGVKLFNKKAFQNVEPAVDITTSTHRPFVAMEKLSCLTEFNDTPFGAWRGAFRECTKLSSKIIVNQVDHETEQRLHTWCTVGEERKNGAWAVLGAKMGKEYGSKHRESAKSLEKINDYKWLKDEFDKLKT